jgi:hypothetical protein
MAFFTPIFGYQKAKEAYLRDGNAVGNALVVYDPSVTGNIKDIATVIVSNLQSKG